MDTILSEQELRELYDQSIRVVTEQTSGIVLAQREVHLRRENICTLYTHFNRRIHSGLAMCADTGLFTRLTQRMMPSDPVDFQDVEDSSKEYFNVLCGHIAVALFHNKKVGVRFQLPEFHRGWYQPKEYEGSWELDFLSDANEMVRLIHYKAPSEAYTACG